MKLVSAKCPNCGANLELNEKNEKAKCNFCNSTIIVEDAIAHYNVKVNVEGKISIDGIESNSDLIESANRLLEMQEYLKAKKKFQEFSEKCPNDYQGWLGLLICRTRNFTIKDDNILFENDIRKYYEHFLRTSSKDVNDFFVIKIENYLKNFSFDFDIYSLTGLEQNDYKEEIIIPKGVDEVVKITKKFSFYLVKWFLLIIGSICMIGSFGLGYILSGILFLIMMIVYTDTFEMILLKQFKINNRVIKKIRIFLPIIAFFSLGLCNNS